jgi:hypothetical protein
MFLDIFTNESKMKSWNVESKYSTPLLYGLNTFRSNNWLNKSHNKLHRLTLRAITVFNIIFEWLPHLCTPHIQLTVRSLSKCKNTFYHTPGSFTTASQRGPCRWAFKKSRHWVSLWAWWSYSLHWMGYQYTHINNTVGWCINTPTSTTL